MIVIAAAAQHQQLITPARDRYRKTNTYLTPSTYSYSYLRKMKKSMRVSFLVALTAGLAVLSVVSAEDAPAAALPESCTNLDPSTLDTSNPAALATLLPCTGWDQTCQSNVMAAGASCIQEIQAIMQWLNTSGLMTAAESATGLSAANATSDPDAIANQTASEGAGISPDVAKAAVTAYLPQLKDALGTCCGGGITPTCCSAMDPIVSGNCLCQQQPVEMLEKFIGQSPANFVPLAADILGQLGCSALNDAKVYPNCS